MRLCHLKNYGDQGGASAEDVRLSSPRRMTLSEISVILQMIRKPNLIIVVLLIQNNA